MQKITTLVFLLYLLSVPAPAQTGGGEPGSVLNLSYLSPASLQLSEFSAVNRVEGSPYFRESWDPGRILFGEYEDFSEKLGIALDLEAHQLYVKLDNGFVGKLPIEKIEAVRIYLEADSILWRALDLEATYGDGPKRRQYYEVVYEGEKLVFLHGQNKYLRREDYVENLGMVRRPDKYMSRDTYWLIRGKRLTGLKNCNERALRKAMPDLNGRIKKLAKSNDLDLKTYTDVRRLFEILEQ